MSTTSQTYPNSRNAFILLLTLSISVAFIWLISGFLEAIFMAAIIAVIGQPLYRKVLEISGGYKSLASGITIVIMFTFLILPFLSFTNILTKQTLEVSQQLDQLDLKKLQQSTPELSKITGLLPDFLTNKEAFLSKARELIQSLGGFISKLVASVARGAGNFFMLMFVMLYALFYFLKDGKTTVDIVFNVLPLSQHEGDRLRHTFSSVSRALIKGSMVIALVQGFLGGLGFAVVGIEAYAFWAVIMAIMSFLPIIGAPVIWVPAVIYLLTTGETERAIGLGLWCMVIVGSADNILRPLLVGRDTQMPDLMVLITTLGGIASFGAVGLLAGPIIGAMFLTIWHFWEQKPADDTNLESQPEEIQAHE